jgi:hypothetical protein
MLSTPTDPVSYAISILEATIAPPDVIVSVPEPLAPTYSPLLAVIEELEPVTNTELLLAEEK